MTIITASELGQIFCGLSDREESLKSSIKDPEVTNTSQIIDLAEELREVTDLYKKLFSFRDGMATSGLTSDIQRATRTLYIE